MRHYKLYPDQFRPGFLADQDELFRIVFEESQDAIFLLHPGSFVIMDCNDRAVRLFEAQDKPELAGRESFDLHDSEPVEFSKSVFIDNINKGMEHSQELAFRSLRGNVFWGMGSLRRIETRKGPVVVFRVRRVVDYMKTAEMLSVLVRQTARVTGFEYFRVLTELLVKSFGVSLSFVASVDEDRKRATIVQCWHKNQMQECKSFSLECSPALNVLKGYTTFYPSNIRDMFPADGMIQALGMESFMGTPVFDGAGEVCGILVIMDDKPMEEIPNSRHMLTIFASRVGAELDRIRTEESYKKQIRELQGVTSNR